MTTETQNQPMILCDTCWRRRYPHGRDEPTCTHGCMVGVPCADCGAKRESWDQKPGWHCMDVAPNQIGPEQTRGRDDKATVVAREYIAWLSGQHGFPERDAGELELARRIREAFPVPDEDLAASGQPGAVHLKEAERHMRIYCEAFGPKVSEEAVRASVLASLHTMLAARERIGAQSARDARRTGPDSHYRDVCDVLGSKQGETVLDVAKRVADELDTWTRDAREHSETIHQVILALGQSSEWATPDDRRKIVAAVRDMRVTVEKLKREHKEPIDAENAAKPVAQSGPATWTRYTDDREPRFGDIVRLAGMEGSSRGLVVLWTIGGATVHWEGHSGRHVGPVAAYSSASLEYLAPEREPTTRHPILVKGDAIESGHHRASAAVREGGTFEAYDVTTGATFRATLDEDGRVRRVADRQENGAKP